MSDAGKFLMSLSTTLLVSSPSTKHANLNINNCTVCIQDSRLWGLQEWRHCPPTKHTPTHAVSVGPVTDMSRPPTLAITVLLTILPHVLGQQPFRTSLFPEQLQQQRVQFQQAELQLQLQNLQRRLQASHYLSYKRFYMAAFRHWSLTLKLACSIVKSFGIRRVECRVQILTEPYLFTRRKRSLTGKALQAYVNKKTLPLYLHIL